MANQPTLHFDEAANRVRDAIVVVQDGIYGTMGVIGILIVVSNSVELNAHPREAGTLVAAGTFLIVVAAVRWVIRRSARRTRD